jgi:SWI/SNF-related matrix-associated actin-dependent regulator of chromatin subfamily A3
MGDSIVFSSWKRTLDLAGDLLSANGIRYDVVTGSVPLKTRQKVLKDFKSLMGVSVLLMTLGTGAVGYVPHPLHQRLMKL